MKIPSTTNFTIQGGDSSFFDRQKALFDRLSQAEKDCNKDQTIAVNYADYKYKRSNILPPGQHHSKTRQFRGKESIFKKPQLPSLFRQNKAIPDYHKNPHKWTKYTLEDVQSADMSDKSNTTTALSFLKELKARKSKNHVNNDPAMDINDSWKNDLMKPGNSSSSNSKPSESSIIVFKKPLQKNKEQKPFTIVDDDKSPVFRGSKVILPEYVVGGKPITKPKKDRKNFTKVDRSKQMKLDHLEIFEEDDDSS